MGYKIISKVLCQRLTRLLPRLVSETQSAFVTGRLISDNILIAHEMFHGLRTNNSCKEKFLAIKTDMSKAYDRVEWPFIEAMLLKLGFTQRWVSRIMSCITSVQYKVLINGQPKGHIVPNRGLRQDDPLSPYLFILCTEALIADIRKKEEEKLLTGLKIVCGSPAISHLLFADDSLFFSKANRQECEVILQILKDYERASGQQINFLKSSLQCDIKSQTQSVWRYNRFWELIQLVECKHIWEYLRVLGDLKHRFLVFLMKELIIKVIIGLFDSLRKAERKF